MPEPTPTTASPPDAPDLDRDLARGGVPLNPDVEHFYADCPVHGRVLHSRHRAGFRAGAQRYKARCLECHSAYNVEHPPAVRSRGVKNPTRSTTTDDTPSPAPEGASTTTKKDPMASTQPAPGTVQARPITFAEVAHMDENRGKQDIYLLTEIGTLTPATIEITSRRREESKSRRHSRSYYAATIDEAASEKQGGTVYKPDVARGPVGEYLKVEIRDAFGHIRDGGLFTTPEAEEAVVLLERMPDPGGTRRNIYVPDSHADEMPLTPTYGSMLTFSGVIADLAPDEVAARAEKALRAEFGDALRRNVKVLTRPAEDRRVDVADSVTGKTLALGILAAEVHLVNRSGNSVTVTDSDPDVVVG